jgi:predicted nucleic acid-binding protein
VGVEALRRRLSEHKLVFLDTMVFVYVLERNPVYLALTRDVLGSIEAGRLEGLTSALTLAEVLTGPAQVQNVEAMRDYELYLTNFPHLKIVGVGQIHASTIARVRALTGLRTPDAVQIAIAQVEGAGAIIGNDKAWVGKTGAIEYLLLDSFR